MQNIKRLGTVKSALLGLVMFAIPSYCDEVTDLIGQLQSQPTRTAALMSLMKKGDERAVKPMFAVLADEAAETIKNRGSGSYDAASCIGNMRYRQEPQIIKAIDKETEGLVRRMLDSPDFMEKNVLIRALGRIGSPVGLQVLIKLLDDKQLGGEALNALIQMKDRGTGALKKWAFNTDIDARRAVYALEKIATLHSLNAIDELAKMHPNSEVRSRAQISSKKLIPILEKKHGMKIEKGRWVRMAN